MLMESSLQLLLLHRSMQLSSSLSLRDFTSSDVNDTEFAGIIISSGFEAAALPLGRWLPGDGEECIIFSLLLLIELRVVFELQQYGTTTTTSPIYLFHLPKIQKMQMSYFLGAKMILGARPPFCPKTSVFLWANALLAMVLLINLLLRQRCSIFPTLLLCSNNINML